MLNELPSLLGHQLTSPFELVHNNKVDALSWFQLFSMRYYLIQYKNSESASTTQVQKNDAIVFAPTYFQTRQIETSSYDYPHNIIYDGGSFATHSNTALNPLPKLFPPGTRVNIVLYGTMHKGTIQHILLP